MPAPPSILSIPTPPSSRLLPALPTSVLSSSLPIASMSATPVSVSCSICWPDSEYVIEVMTTSMPAPSASMTTSNALSTR
ncbi:MAG: hypothetical protein E5W39_05800 [Mesorhizobium sp.]|nr:MAG: hypothetical protein E5W39_05800 [Mesorhizobium sp.]